MIRQSTFVVSGLIGASVLLGVQQLSKHQNTILDSALTYEYSFTHNAEVQSSYTGTITALYTTSHTPEEKREEYKKVSGFFSAPVYLLTDAQFSSQGNVHSKSVEHVFHRWMRDLFLFSKDSVLANPYIILNRDSSPRNKRHFIDQVRDSLDILVDEGFEPETTPFMFEGGQVLRTDAYTLVPDFFNDARNFMIPSEALSEYEIKQLYTNSVGNTLFVPTSVDGQSYLSGHLDMFITPVDANTVFVADYELGKEFLEQVSEEELAIFKQHLTDRYMHKGGHTPKQVSVVPSPGGEEVFNQAASFLSQYFTVKRMPFVQFEIEGETNEKGENHEIMISYNNVLLDYSSGKAVIPSFGLPVLDAYAEQMYREQGYTSLLVLDSIDGAITHSGIHCDYLEKRSY
jgi:hypothetical protein